MKKQNLKVEKVKNFQRNYLKSEKFFSKFSYFERENFQNLKVIESKKISTKLSESEKFFTLSIKEC